MRVRRLNSIELHLGWFRMSHSLQLKRHDRLSNFHVTIKKMLAFVLKRHSFGLPLKMPWDPVTSQNSKFGHGGTIGETMATDSASIPSGNLCVS